MTKLVDNCTASRPGSLTPLFFAPFFMCLNMNLFWVALPYIAHWLGGSDTMVGLCCGLFWGVYAVSCMLSGTIFRHLPPKKTVQLGIATMAASTLMVAALVLWQRLAGGKIINPGEFSLPALVMALLTIPYGVGMAFFWPFLMSWISSGLEGPRLNRCLGLFSISFSSANVISPFLGALLVKVHFLPPLPLLGAVNFDIGYLPPLLGATLSLIFCLVAVSLPHSPGAASAATESTLIPEHLPPTLERYRWVARIGLFISCAAVGLTRGQLPLHFKDLRFDETQFGIYVSMICVGNLISFLITSRSQAWHYRRGIFYASELLVIAGLALIARTQSYAWFLAAALLMGWGSSFIYASHLYYSMSGSRRRSSTMALHETTLALGFFVAPFLGGAISDHYQDRVMPYQFGIYACAAAIAIQLVLWLALPLQRGAAGGISRPAPLPQPGRRL